MGEFLLLWGLSELPLATQWICVSVFCPGTSMADQLAETLS